MSKPKVTTRPTQIDASKLKRRGVLTPEEVAAWMIICGFPQNAQVIAEGLATVDGESGFNSEADNGQGYLGLWQEEEGFGGIANADRTDAKISTEKAYERWKADGESFVGAWGKWDAEARGNYADYMATAERVIKQGVNGVEGASESAAAATEGVTGGVSLSAVEATAKAAAFSAYLELPGVFDSMESIALKGTKSLMNDQPLLPLVEQLSQASLRRFQSLPNGNFYGFYPDYFGGMNHHTPYWEIDDIEILDAQMNLSDDTLATHVYVVGDTVGLYDGVSIEDEASSSGVVTLFQAMACNFIAGTKITSKGGKTGALATKQQVMNFLKKYGARPYFEEAPMVRSGYYEMFLAYQRFCLLWSKQFEAEFKLTFMPELFPGGLVAFPNHGIQLFVESVEHNMDYQDGFTTDAVFSCPAALANGPNGIHDGMIRANALS